MQPTDKPVSNESVAAPKSYGRGGLRDRMESTAGLWPSLSQNKKRYFEDLFNRAGCNLEQFIAAIENPSIVEDDAVEDITRKIVLILSGLSLDWDEKKSNTPDKDKAKEYQDTIKNIWDNM